MNDTPSGGCVTRLDTRQMRELRDARAAELVDEPDSVLEGMAQGAIECTPASRILARQELDYRRLRR